MIQENNDLSQFMPTQSSPHLMNEHIIHEETSENEDDKNTKEKAEPKKKKIKVKGVQMMSIVKRNKLLKSQEKARKRALAGKTDESETSSSSEDEEETLEQKKKAARIALFNELKDMPPAERKELLRKRANRSAEMDSDDEKRDEDLL